MPNRATVHQIIQAYESLSPDEVVALRRAARHHLGGTRFTEPLDIIHEAMALLIEGQRTWPLHVDFCRFMYATMRSIANNERQNLGNRLASGSCLDDLIDSGQLVDDASRDLVDALQEREAQRIATEAARRAHSALRGDLKGQIVIESMLADLEPAEVCANFNWTMNDYRAARQRALLLMRKFVAGRMA